MSPTLFVNPGNFFVTPIWYKFDKDAERGCRWFWTPFPEDDVVEKEARWISVNTDQVRVDMPLKKGARTFVFKGEKPVKQNLKIIRYLRRNDPEPENLETYESS